MTNDREKFEKRFPIPAGVFWSENTGYRPSNPEAVFALVQYGMRWEAWQACAERKQREIDELAAQVEVMREALLNIADNVCDRMIERGPVVEGTNFYALQLGIRQTISLTQSDTLCEVKARTLEEADGREPCPYCNDTGDVHRADGEWLGECKECSTIPSANVQELPFSIDKTELYELRKDNAYLESRIAELERERDGWKENAEHARESLRIARCDIDLLTKQAAKDVWVWQGDGDDRLDSMGARMVVTIYAGDLRTELAKARAEAVPDAVIDNLQRILDWCNAYPLEVFPEPDFKTAHELLKAGGLTLDAISAANMRHVLNGVRGYAEAAMLAAAPKPGEEK